MPLKPHEKPGFISDSLYHELRCLLGAATVWQILKNHHAGFDVAVAMDSAFVHARNLFNFFTEDQGGVDVSVTEFGPTDPYPSPVYDEWREPLHRHLLHIAKGRINPTNLHGTAHLKDQVLAFATAILDLWSQLQSDPAAAPYASLLADARARAIQDSINDAGTRIQPLFH